MMWPRLTRDVRKEIVLIILAGGRGKRLRPYLRLFAHAPPKPMLEIYDRPLLAHIATLFVRQQIRVVICANYKARIIQTYFKREFHSGRRELRPTVLRDIGEKGTIGALANALDFARTFRNAQTAVVVNGDTVADFRNLDKAICSHLAAATPITVVLTRRVDAANRNKISVGSTGTVLQNHEGAHPDAKQLLVRADWAGSSTGITILNVKCMYPQLRARNSGSLYSDFLPANTSTTSAFDYGNAFVLDIGTPQRLRRLQCVSRRQFMQFFGTGY